MVNFKRLKKFAQKVGLEISHLLPEIANALRQYVRAEINDQELWRREYAPSTVIGRIGIGFVRN